MGWRVEIWWWLERKLGRLASWSMDFRGGVEPHDWIASALCLSYRQRKAAERARTKRLTGDEYGRNMPDRV